jgi:glycosyltransferase involved in cell wall biosynthesis
MPKVLYLITELDVGGAEKNLFRLAVALRDRGWDVEVAALSGCGEVGEWLADKSIPVHYARMDFKASPLGFARLVRIIRAARPDVLHTFLFHANVAGRLASFFARVPVVVSSIRVAERRRRSHLFMDCLTQSLVDAQVCVSEGVRQFTAARAHIREDKLVVIANPVEKPVASRPRLDVRQELGAADSDVIVLSVGRLDPQKGFLYLVAAAKELLASRRELLFVVAGEGSQRPALQAAIAAASIQRNFKLLGWRADAADLYAAADVFVLPSLWEGMSNSLLEAAAAGLACVATSVEGSAEIIDEGRTGLLVPPSDPRALAAAIGSLIDDASLRRRLGFAAATRVVTEHSIERFVSAHIALYSRLLAGGGQSGDAGTAE